MIRQPDNDIGEFRLQLNALRGCKIGGKLGKEWLDFNPNELDLTIWVLDYGVKFHQNRVRIATVGGWTDRNNNNNNNTLIYIAPACRMTSEALVG